MALNIDVSGMTAEGAAAAARTAAATGGTIIGTPNAGSSAFGGGSSGGNINTSGMDPAVAALIAANPQLYGGSSAYGGNYSAPNWPDVYAPPNLAPQQLTPAQVGQSAAGGAGVAPGAPQGLTGGSMGSPGVVTGVAGSGNVGVQGAPAGKFGIAGGAPSAYGSYLQGTGVTGGSLAGTMTSGAATGSPSGVAGTAAPKPNYIDPKNISEFDKQVLAMYGYKPDQPIDKATMDAVLNQYAASLNKTTAQAPTEPMFQGVPISKMDATRKENLIAGLDAAQSRIDAGKPQGNDVANVEYAKKNLASLWSPKGDKKIKDLENFDSAINGEFDLTGKPGDIGGAMASLQLADKSMNDILAQITKLDSAITPLEDNLDTLEKDIVSSYADIGQNQGQANRRYNTEATPMINAINKAAKTKNNLLQQFALMREMKNDAQQSIKEQVQFERDLILKGYSPLDNTQAMALNANEIYTDPVTGKKYLRPTAEATTTEIRNYEYGLTHPGFAEISSGNGLTPAQINATVNSIAGAFDNEQLVKDYNTINAQYKFLTSAGSTPTDDISRVYVFAKVMDPNSVVREGEYKTVQDYSQALLQSVGLKGARVFSNTGFLTPEARKFMESTIKRRLDVAKVEYDNIKSEYQRQVDDAYAGNPRQITDYASGNTQGSSYPPLTTSYKDVYTLAKEVPAYASLVEQLASQGYSNEDAMQYIESIQGSFNYDLSTSQKGLINKAVAYNDGTKAGQCGAFVNDLTGLKLGDSYQSKLAKMDKTIKEPQPGMVFVMPYKSSGHTGIILSVKDGVATVKDSNWSLNEKVKTHTIPVSKMTGFAKA